LFTRQRFLVAAPHNFAWSYFLLGGRHLPSTRRLPEWRQDLKFSPLLSGTRILFIPKRLNPTTAGIFLPENLLEILFSKKQQIWYLKEVTRACLTAFWILGYCPTNQAVKEPCNSTSIHLFQQMRNNYFFFVSNNLRVVKKGG
jgi:hypothetical protein